MDLCRMVLSKSSVMYIVYIESPDGADLPLFCMFMFVPYIRISYHEIILLMRRLVHKPLVSRGVASVAVSPGLKRSVWAFSIFFTYTGPN